MKTKKTIIFIPPNGMLKRQDFSLQRLAQWFTHDPQVHTTLLHIQNGTITAPKNFDEIITVTSQEEILTQLQEISHTLIFHRAWMHAYPFAARLTLNFKNVIVNIKDWNFAPKEIYKFLFGSDEDFKAIETIFTHAKKILSHYTNEQHQIWANTYHTDVKRFLFFPEYCNEEKCIERHISYEDHTKLVYAGKISSSSLPEEYFPGKSHLRCVQQLAKNRLYIDFVLPEEEYKLVIQNKEKFQDVFYHHNFTPNFSLIKGKALDPTILQNYHFGFFELETSGENEMLYKYAITSKFAFYLEAALPMLINEKFTAMADIVKTYNLGLVFTNDELLTLSEKLRISLSDYQEMVRNIYTFRETYTYNHKIVSDAFFHDLKDFH